MKREYCEMRCVCECMNPPYLGWVVFKPFWFQVGIEKTQKKPRKPWKWNFIDFFSLSSTLKLTVYSISEMSIHSNSFVDISSSNLQNCGITWVGVEWNLNGWKKPLDGNLNFFPLKISNTVYREHITVCQDFFIIPVKLWLFSCLGFPWSLVR